MHGDIPLGELIIYTMTGGREWSETGMWAAARAVGVDMG